MSAAADAPAPAPAGQLTDLQFAHLVAHGRLFSPASDHYAQYGILTVTCDRCGAGPLAIAVGDGEGAAGRDVCVTCLLGYSQWVTQLVIEKDEKLVERDIQLAEARLDRLVIVPPPPARTPSTPLLSPPVFG